MRMLYLTLALIILAAPAAAQYSSQRDARNMAVLKAVVNVKIDDEENLKDMEKLRANQAFNRDLQRMLDKLDNSRTKNSKNKQVLDVLERAGNDIYNLLR